MELLVSLPRLHPSKLEGKLDYTYSCVVPQVFQSGTNKDSMDSWQKRITRQA